MPSYGPGQIGVEDFKYVIVFDPLRTRHVVLRMRMTNYPLSRTGHSKHHLGLLGTQPFWRHGI